jgi:hypothetical protein
MSSLFVIAFEVAVALGIHSWLGWPIWLSAIVAFALENILGTISARVYWPEVYSSLANDPSWRDPGFRFWFRITRLFEVLVVYFLTVGVTWMMAHWKP